MGHIADIVLESVFFRNDVKEAMIDVDPGIKYISEHPEINNVLLTGGDPLILAARKIRYDFPHVSVKSIM